MKAYDVAFTPGFAYVACGDSGVRVVNVNDPQHPIEAGYIATPRPVSDLATQGSYLLAAESDSGLRIIDVSNPQFPQEVAACDSVMASFVAIHGDSRLCRQ